MKEKSSVYYYYYVLMISIVNGFLNECFTFIGIRKKTRFDDGIYNQTCLFTMHFIGRVTMLFADNSLMECLITMKFLHIFFYTLT